MANVATVPTDVRESNYLLPPPDFQKGLTLTCMLVAGTEKTSPSATSIRRETHMHAYTYIELNRKREGGERQTGKQADRLTD